MNRISIREKTFNGIPTEEPLTKIPVVIIGVAFVSRIYYKDAYSSEKVAKPTCWSENQETPALDVPEDQRQSGRCIDCTQNIKGSAWEGICPYVPTHDTLRRGKRLSLL